MFGYAQVIQRIVKRKGAELFGTYRAASNALVPHLRQLQDAGFYPADRPADAATVLKILTTCTLSDDVALIEFHKHLLALQQDTAPVDPEELAALVQAEAIVSEELEGLEESVQGSSSQQQHQHQQQAEPHYAERNSGARGRATAQAATTLQPVSCRIVATVHAQLAHFSF